MAQDAAAVQEQSSLLQNCCVAFAALILLLYLDGQVEELRQAQQSALVAFVLNSAPNLFSAALVPLVFVLFVDRAELSISAVGYGLGLLFYECLQLFIAWAVFDWWDLIATLLGTLLSLVFIRIFKTRIV
jgi:hypothetical protein